MRPPSSSRMALETSVWVISRPSPRAVPSRTRSRAIFSPSVIANRNILPIVIFVKGGCDGEHLATSGEDLAISGERLVTSDEDVAISDEDVAISDEDVATSDERLAISDEDVAISDEDVATSEE